MAVDMRERHSQDKGYAWIIVLSSFMVQTLTHQVVWGVGVYFEIFRTEIGGTFGQVAVVASLNNVAFYVSGPFVGTLTNRYGYRKVCMVGGFLGGLGIIVSQWATELWHLYLSYGIVTGIGLCSAYIPATAILGHYFYKKRAIAFAIAATGCAMGSIIAPPITRFFVETYGWRSSLLLNGAFCWHLCLFGALLRQPTVENDVSTYKSKDRKGRDSGINLSILKNIHYMCLMMSTSCIAFGISIIYIHLGAYAETVVGCSPNEAALLFSIIGLSSFIGRLMYGSLLLCKCFSAMGLYMQGFACAGLATILCPLVSKYSMLVVFAVAFGLFTSCMGPLVPEIMIDLVGVDMLASSMGYMFIFYGIGPFTGGPIAGWMYDSTGFYPASLYLGGSVVFLGAVCMIYPFFFRRKSNTNISMDVYISNSKEAQTLSDISCKT